MEEKRNVFKENWEKVDEVCSACGQVTKRQKGITRQNIKRLFSLKMNYTEFLITFMLIMIMVLAYSYMNETKTSREWVSSMKAGSYSDCNRNCEAKCSVLYQNLNISFSENNSNLTIWPSISQYPT